MKYPPITSYQSYANCLSILCYYDNENIWNYIFSSFIQLSAFAKHDKGFNMLDFYPRTIFNCPLLECEQISRKDISSKANSIVEFIVNKINLGYYITLNIDTYYISIYKTFHKLKGVYPHDIYIWGYDLNDKVFYVSEFLSKFEYTTVSFSELEQGYMNFKAIDSFSEDVGLIMYKGGEYKLSLNTIIDLTKDYLFSNNSSKRLAPTQQFIYNSDTHWGLDIYKLLKECIIKSNSGYLLRYLHILFDHKVLMSLRIKYLIEKKYILASDSILQQYELIKKQAMIIRNLAIKSKVSDNPKYFYKIYDYIDTLQQIERQSLESLLDYLVLAGRRCN